jgi:uncharacterized protein YkwD
LGMHWSIRRHLHPCPRGRAAGVWRGSLILVLSLMSHPAVGICATVRARTPTPKPASPCANASLQPAPDNLAAIDTATLCLVNQVRAADHLRSLRFNGPLQSVAAGQALDMVQGNYFGDDSLSGQTPMQRILASTYPAHAVHVNAAQNIGWATGPLATPAAMLQAWMSSAPHRKIILTPSFHDIGVGVTPAAPSSLAQGLAGATYTLEFGQRIFTARAAGR